ncbi:TPA: hypothetical protein QIM54_004865 [Klebsiella aerogenes]|nr:hypothetical protein [Klebsiella aerogenes]
MVSRTVEQRLEELERKEREIREQKKKLVARVSSEKRKQETRQKILLGAFVMSQWDRNPELRRIVESGLSGFLNADSVSDRVKANNHNLLSAYLCGEKAADNG